MLNLLRRKSQSTYLQATIIIIILVFIFWGVGTNMGNNAQNAVASINGENISYQDYQKEYDRTYSALRDQFGGAIPNGLLDSLNIKQQVLNKLVQTTLLRQGALKAGLYVSDQELRTAIQEMEAFKNNGVFDAKWYEEVLTNSRMTVSKFEAGMRYDLLSAKVIDHLGRFIHPSETALRDQFNTIYQTTKFDYVEFPAATFADRVDKTDEAIKTFFEENKANYQSEPQIKINYLLYSFDSADKLPVPDDSEIERIYQNNLERYTTQEKRSARHILFRTGESPEKDTEQKAKAEEVLAKINSGSNFAEMAKEFSEDGSASRGGDLGSFQRDQMVKPFADAVFTMSEGQVSNIVQTQFGYHIIKLEKIEAARVKPITEVRPQIIAQIQQESRKVAPFDQANAAYEKIILSGSLATYIEQEKADGRTVPLTTTELFTQVDPPETLKSLPEIVNEGFSLKQGELSSIIETSQGYAIISVDKTQAPAQQELTAVRETVEKDYIQKKSEDLAKETAETLLASLKKGADFTDEAKKVGAELKSTPYISKNDLSAATLPSQVLQNVLTLSATNKYPEEIARAGDTLYVVGFNDRKDPDESIFEAKKDELKAQVIKERNNELLTAWIENLRRSAEITTNEQLL